MSRWMQIRRLSIAVTLFASIGAASRAHADSDDDFAAIARALVDAAPATGDHYVGGPPDTPDVLMAVRLDRFESLARYGVLNQYQTTKDPIISRLRVAANGLLEVSAITDRRFKKELVLLSKTVTLASWNDVPILEDLLPKYAFLGWNDPKACQNGTWFQGIDQTSGYGGLYVEIKGVLDRSTFSLGDSLDDGLALTPLTTTSPLGPVTGTKGQYAELQIFGPVTRTNVARLMVPSTELARLTPEQKAAIKTVANAWQVEIFEFDVSRSCVTNVLKSSAFDAIKPLSVSYARDSTPALLERYRSVVRDLGNERLTDDERLELDTERLTILNLLARRDEPASETQMTRDLVEPDRQSVLAERNIKHAFLRRLLSEGRNNSLIAAALVALAHDETSGREWLDEGLLATIADRLARKGAFADTVRRAFVDPVTFAGALTAHMESSLAESHAQLLTQIRDTLGSATETVPRARDPEDQDLVTRSLAASRTRKIREARVITDPERFVDAAVGLCSNDDPRDQVLWATLWQLGPSYAQITRVGAHCLGSAFMTLRDRIERHELADSTAATELAALFGWPSTSHDRLAELLRQHREEVAAEAREQRLAQAKRGVRTLVDSVATCLEEMGYRSQAESLSMNWSHLPAYLLPADYETSHKSRYDEFTVSLERAQKKYGAPNATPQSEMARRIWAGLNAQKATFESCTTGEVQRKIDEMKRQYEEYERMQRPPQ
jgi:hypothetical protein